MATNPTRCTWLDLQAHDRMVDEQFIEADKYEDFNHFLHDESGHTSEPPENLSQNA